MNIRSFAGYPLPSILSHTNDSHTIGMLPVNHSIRCTSCEHVLLFFSVSPPFGPPPWRITYDKLSQSEIYSRPLLTFT